MPPQKASFDVQRQPVPHILAVHSRLDYLLIMVGRYLKPIIIKKKDKLLGRFILYFTCKIWNKGIQYVVLFKHDILGIFIPYFTGKIWNKTTQ